MRRLRRLTASPWLAASELRIGLGCMRLSTDPDRDETLAAQTIAAAVEVGITVFDTAHAYGQGGPEMGHDERLLAAALSRSGAAATARVITKGGMTRPAGAWLPDGRAKRILSDCEASLTALDGVPIDLYLIHAPDPRTPWRTSVRALARLLEEGMVRRVGLSNVNRHQLDEALELVPVTAVEVALSLHDDRALRVVLDNSYLTRAARSYVIDATGRHGIPTRCVWLQTTLAQAQVNWSSGCSRASARCRPPRTCEPRRGASRACSPRPSRCARCASSSPLRPTRASPRSR